MQQVSKAYKEAMKKPFRNRGYIRVRIGVVNSRAQDIVSAVDDRNEFTYFSTADKPFQGYVVDNIYATAEQNFSHVDGTMYFLPSLQEDVTYYNGIVTNALLGSVYVDFKGAVGFDIKGLTIDFGECYPSKLTVEYDGGTRNYENNKRIFVTEDVFNGTSFLRVTPLEMVNGNGRLRIYQFICGIANTFTNAEVLNYSMKDFVSPISETIPSQDMSLTVDNQNLYYSVDNPDSALVYMEVGQEVKTAFGYDVTGNGDIEWVKENTTYLKTWTANDTQAKFTATDRFDYLTGKYYGGLYRENGISLYDLTIDVLNDAGITDEREYFIDPYLRNVIVYNPMPAVKYTEALQIIANAGRCILYEDRENRIHLKASFVPDMEASVNNQTEYSNIENLLKDDTKEAYAICSNDFTTVDGNVMFMPANPTDYNRNMGYVSNSIADDEGTFEENPKITITLEAGFVAFGLIVRFRNATPQEFHIVSYYQDLQVQDMTVENPELEYVFYDEFPLLDRMELVFTKGHPNARITVDSVLIGDITDYTLSRWNDIKNTPTGTRKEKIKSISVERITYRNSTEEPKELKQEEIVLQSGNTEYTVYFTNPSYGFNPTVEGNNNVTCSVVESSSYYAKLLFSGVESNDTVVKYVLWGNEYIKDSNYVTVQHNVNGSEETWSNPLVSIAEHARDLEEWLASYLLGDVEYQVSWRGDPRVDANDLFYLELKNQDTALVRGYETTLKYKGAWEGSTKARKVVLSWR